MFKINKEADNTDQVVGALVALLLGLLHLVHHLIHLVHHLIGRGIKSKFRISLKSKKFTSVVIWSRFSCMAMAAWVVPRKSSRRKKIEFFVFISGS